MSILQSLKYVNLSIRLTCTNIQSLNSGVKQMGRVGTNFDGLASQKTAASTLKVMLQLHTQHLLQASIREAVSLMETWVRLNWKD